MPHPPPSRQLSRHLVTLWVTGNPTANGLLHRMLVSCRCLQPFQQLTYELGFFFPPSRGD